MAATKPSKTDLLHLAESLPPLDFTLDTPTTDAFSSELYPHLQDYLDYYRINFAREGISNEHHCGQFQNNGSRISCHVWLAQEQRRGTVFFVHGYTDHVGLMQHALRHLLQHGWNVVAFDLPGHGLSSGEPASIESFDVYRDTLLACLDHCKSSCTRLNQPWHGVGQSTGGAVWLHYLSSEACNIEVDKVCLLAPLVRPRSWGWLQWCFPMVYRCITQLPRHFNHSSHDPDFLHFLEFEDPLQVRHTPLRWVAAMRSWISRFIALRSQDKTILVIQGDQDTTVDFRYNIPLILQKFPQHRLVTIPGAKHQLVNESLPYRQPVLAAIEQYLTDD